MSSRRMRKQSQRKNVSESRRLGGEEREQDPDKTYVPSSRKERRSVGERSTPTGLTIGARDTLGVKDLLANKKRKRGGTGQPEHFQRWSAATNRRKYLSTHPVTVLEPELGKQVNNLANAGYRTAQDVAKEWNYQKLSGIKGVGPAFLGKLRALLLDVGFTVNWRV